MRKKLRIFTMTMADGNMHKTDDIYNPELANSIRHYKEEGESNMCPSVREYGDIREAEGEARGEARAAARYQDEIEKLKAELAKYKTAEKNN